MAATKFLIQQSRHLKEKAGVVTSAGAANAGDIPALDSSGKLDTTVLPSGIGAATKVVVASESLTAGDFVNIYDNAGTASVRKANATDTTKPTHGFVKAGVSSGANATVYLDGENNSLTDLLS